MEMGKGLRAYVTVRASGNHHQRVDHTGAVALCRAHVKPYEDLILNGAAASAKASVHLVAKRPDIDEELKRSEAGPKGRSVCVLCSHGLGWKPSGRGVAMADLEGPVAIASACPTASRGT